MSAPYLPEHSAPARAEIDTSKGLVLLEFGTDWCGYCKAFAPSLERALADRPAIRHIKVEDGKGRALGRSFGVRLWPNLVFLKDGVVLHQLVRPHERELQEALQRFS